MTALAETHARGLLRAGRGAFKQVRQTIKRARHGLKALEARFKRSRSRATFIAVTGSSSKTTTVSLLTHILSAEAKVRTQVLRNGFDNAVTTLRRLTREDQFTSWRGGLVYKPNRHGSVYVSSGTSFNPSAARTTRSFSVRVHVFARGVLFFVLTFGTLAAARSQRDRVGCEIPTSLDKTFALTFPGPVIRRTMLARNPSL